MSRDMEKHCVALMITKIVGGDDAKITECAAMIDRYYEGFKDDLDRDMERELTVDEQRLIDKAVADYDRPSDPTAGRREIVAQSIRDYCERKLHSPVQVSSDGKERIYYTGLPVLDLTDAILAVLDKS